MTTLQTQQRIPPLGVLLSGDPMDVTTDMDRHFEASEDIDIDLDLTDDVQQDGEDEYMGEDDEEIVVGEQGSHTANDDEMADGGYVEGSIAGRSSVHDEDLEDADYIKPGIEEDAIVDVAVENPSDPSSDLLDNEEQIDASGPHPNKHVDQGFNVNNHPDQDYHEQLDAYESDLDARVGSLPNGQKEAPSISNGESGPTNEQPALKNYEGHSERQQGTLAISPDKAEPAILEPSQEEHDENHGEHDESRHPGIEETVGNPPWKLEHAKRRTEQIETTAPSQDKLATSSNIDPETHPQNQPIALDGAFTVESIHVHPVVMVYQENEISLFPPVSQDGAEEGEEERSSTYFLEDEQLASDSIQNLLGALRSVLGESISEQDELTIDIEELGLHISEFSTDCSITSLSEVMDIYVQLQHYDGLDSPPPLYMNLTTKAKFSHRLESLLLAIAEQKGLSQTRSSYGVEERQQLEAEEVPDPNTRDDLHQADVLPDRKVKTFVPSQDGTAGNNGDETAQNDPVPSSSLLDKSKPLTPPLKAYASADNTKRGNDEASANATNRGKVVTLADGQQCELLRTDLTKSSPQLAPPTALERHVLEEPILDDDDFIDYEDDEESAQVTSSESSTLRGDVFDVTADEINAISEKNIPQEEPAELQGTGNIRENTAKEEKVTHDAPHDKANDSIPETGEQGQSDFVDHRAEYLEYSEEEDNAASSEERFDIEEKLRGIERSSQPQDQDNPPARNTNNNQEGFKQPQHESAPLQADVFREQRNMVNGARDDLVGTQLDNEQEHEDHTNTSRPDYENTGAVLHYDEYRGESDGHEDTKLAEPNVSSLVSNDDFVDESSPIGKTEPQLSLYGQGHSQDDDDEITYEDEEDEGQTPIDTFPAKRNSIPSSVSLKRARSLCADDSAIENDLQDAKRIRST